MQKNEVNFKALTFISEQTASTFNYEVKGVRALWDPSLSIPGTNRRGGWRCPVGTRYGGQITDRFGRSCGWGVARRIANQIADIGERLENIDDRKRNNRIAKRNARMQRLLSRQQKPGFLERGARGVAEALDSEQSPQLPVADIDSVSPRPRRRRGKLRESEQRRMEREIVEPGAPRTGEPPKPNRPRGRRRAATQQGARRTARRKPEADFVDGSKPVPTAVPQRKPKIDLRERDSGLERLLDEEAEVERQVENALRLENVDNEFFENLDEDALLRLMNQIKLLPDYQNRNDWKRLRREWNLRPREARDAATKRDMQRFNPPRREPPSAPPKPLVVEPDPDFNAPDLGGSLPDTRSERNVRNRFRERGLPDTAYWREDAYQGDDKAELERRFGRYYDDNNQRNARGDYVNRKIKKETNTPAKPRSQPSQPPRQPGNSDNAARSEELRQNREAMAEAAFREGMAEAAVEDARQRADNAENAVRARIPSDEVERQRQIAELRKLVSEAERNLDQMERNGARDAIVREEQRRRDALRNRIGNLQDTRTRDLDGAIIIREPEPAPAPPAPRASRAPRRPREKNRQQRRGNDNASRPAPRTVDSDLAKAKENDNKLAPRDFNGLGTGKRVDIGNKNINTKQDAVAHVNNGGDLADVPDEFVYEAIKKNSTTIRVGRPGQPGGPVDTSKRFIKLKPLGDPSNNSNGQIQQYKDATTGKKLLIKYDGRRFRNNEDVNEILANEIQGRLGYPVGEFRFAGPVYRDRHGQGRPILFEHAENYIDGTVAPPQPNGYENSIPLNDKVRLTMLDFLILNTDRHGGNFFVQRDANGQDHIVPYDPSLGFAARYFDPDLSYADEEGFKKWLKNDVGGRRNRLIKSLRTKHDSETGRDAGRTRTAMIEEARKSQQLLREAEAQKRFAEFGQNVIDAAGQNPQVPPVTGASGARASEPRKISFTQQRIDWVLSQTPEQIVDAMLAPVI